jgi:hypothetical protein
MMGLTDRLEPWTRRFQRDVAPPGGDEADDGRADPQRRAGDRAEPASRTERFRRGVPQSVD